MKESTSHSRNLNALLASGAGYWSCYRFISIICLVRLGNSENMVGRWTRWYINQSKVNVSQVADHESHHLLATLQIKELIHFEFRLFLRPSNQITLGTMLHPWPRDTRKCAAQGPNIMSPEAPMTLPEARRAELEGRGRRTPLWKGTQDRCWIPARIPVENDPLGSRLQ